MTRLLSSLLAATDAPPFAVIHREHESTLDVLVGDVVDVDRLADIPLGDAEVLALVPFRQVRERGFAAHDDDAPIRCLVVRERESVAVDDAVRLMPRHPVIVDDLDVDVTDEEYAAIVRRVIDDEIGRGEGANFVIRREFTGSTDAAPATAVLGWLRALLEHESGAYWTFALCTPGLAAAGATPERHVSSIDGVVSMNPISGTFRHGDAGRDDDAFLAFLDDVKEREELVMVVDEELKMMSAVCPDGGRIRGPFLKRMSRLTHTEYLLEGRSALDPREVLRAHDVRTHGDRVADGQRLCGDRTPRDDASRVLRGRARALHAAPGRRRPRRADPHPHGVPRRRRTRARARGRDARAALRPGGRGRRDAARRPPACSPRSAPSRGRPRPVATSTGTTSTGCSTPATTTSPPSGARRRPRGRRGGPGRS